MDIYQIIVSNNPPWSRREVIAFLLIFLIAAIVLGFLYKKKKLLLSQVFAGLAMLGFLGIVFASTVFTRITGSRQYELELFWSWKEVIFHGNQDLLQENLLNIVLLFPAGLLLPLFFHRRLPWWAGLLFGVILSAGIEVCQLVFCRGLFEWDDIVHNGIGCMLGCVISGMIVTKIFKYS